MTDEAKDIATDEFARKVSGYTSTEASPDEALELFAEARQRCPVAHSEKQGGFYLVVKYDDVKAANSDWETFSSSPAVVRPLMRRPSMPPIEIDPPEHRIWRGLFRHVTNPTVPKLIEDGVRSDAAALVARIGKEGSCDLVAYAEEVALGAMCRFVGFDGDKRAEVIRLTMEKLNDPDRGLEVLDPMLELAMDEVLARREDPRDDFLTFLSSAEVDGRPMTTDEISVAINSLLVAAHETSATGLTNLIFQVLSRPEIKARLIADPDLIPAAAEETLRLNPPIFGLFRRATKATQIGGVEIAADESVLLCWAGANRDPEVFEDPESFRLERWSGRSARHLTFGFGPHSCPGAPIARMEMRVGLEELLRGVPTIRLVDPEAVEFRFRGSESAAIHSLPAAVDADE